MRKTIIIIFFLFFKLNFFSQQIKILSADKFEENNKEYFIIKCILINNMDKELVFPMKMDKIYNHFSYFFRIETKPKKAFDSFDHPPLPVGAVHYKLTKEDILKIPANTSIEIELDTRKMYGGDLYLRWVKNLYEIRKIKIMYAPFNFENRNEDLENEIKDIQFYSQKIESKYFKTKK